MAMKAAKRFSVRTDATVFKRLGRVNQENMAIDVFNRLGSINQENIARNHQVKTVVCKYWLEGRCTRNPCKFFHPRAKPDTFKSKYAWKNPNTFKSENSPPIEKTQQKDLINKENHEHNQTGLKKQQKVLTREVKVGQSQTIEKTENCMKSTKIEVNVGQSLTIEKSENCMQDKKNEVIVGQSQSTKNCTKGENCDTGFSMIAQLEGHTKAVTGIVYPNGSNKLFSGSKDKSLRVWDCNNGQCGNVVNFDNECRTLVKEGPWIFAGLQNMIKAWNFETQNEVIIRANGGYVNAITMYEDILFAGMEDGSILSWKTTSKTIFSEEATCLKGHTGSVLSLIVGAKRLFSGSADHTIRVWDCESLECTHVLNGHTGDVTAVICWDQFLFSGSLDKTIKIWGETESGDIVQVYQHDVDDGVVAFCGMQESKEKPPFLLCSCKDNGVYVYDLPSFSEKGRIYSRVDIQTIQVGPAGLIITGDTAGLIKVWKPNGELVCK